MILEEAYEPKVAPAERVPVGPFLAFLGYWSDRHSDDSARALCVRAGFHIRDLDKAVDVGTVSIKFVDAVLVAAGEPPDVLRELYPLAPRTDGV